MCLYIHILHNIETLIGQNKYKKIGTAVNAACQGNLSASHFRDVCHRFVSPALRHGTCVWMKKLEVRRQMLDEVVQVFEGSENLKIRKNQMLSWMSWSCEGLTKYNQSGLAYDELIFHLILLGKETLKMQLPLADSVSIGRPAPRPPPRTVLGQHLAQLLKINMYIQCFTMW